MATAALTILAVLALFAVSSLTAAAETPFVVAHKKASVVKLKSGSERVSVSIDVYNHGSLLVLLALLFFTALCNLILKSKSAKCMFLYLYTCVLNNLIPFFLKFCLY